MDNQNNTQSKGRAALVSRIIAAIEKIADPAWAAAWDRSGLQTATTRLDAGKLAVTLDPTPEKISEALAWGAEFILTHHPLAIKPDLPNELNNYYYALKELLSADVALYAAHTSLDVNLLGPAGWLGRALGLRNKQILEPTGENRGFGMAGNLPEAVSLDELLDGLCELLKIETIAVANPIERGLISRIAYCGGSGGSLIDQAERLGAQVFISGDLKYHAALDSWICLADVGHHSIEEEMTRRLAEDLRAALPEIEIRFFASTAPYRLYQTGKN